MIPRFIIYGEIRDAYMNYHRAIQNTVWPVQILLRMDAQLHEEAMTY